MDADQLINIANGIIQGGEVIGGTSQEKITYATLDSKIVTVTSKGVVTAKKKGSGRILVRSGAVAVIVYVTVK